MIEKEIDYTITIRKIIRRKRSQIRLLKGFESIEMYQVCVFWLGIIVVVLSEARNCSIVYSKLPNKTDENFVILRNFSPSTLFSPNKQKNSPTFLFFSR